MLPPWKSTKYPIIVKVCSASPVWSIPSDILCAFIRRFVAIPFLLFIFIYFNLHTKTYSLWYTILWVLTNISSCIPITTTVIQNSSTTPKCSQALPLYNEPHLPPQSLETTDLPWLYGLVLFFFLESHINGILYYLAFKV